MQNTHVICHINCRNRADLLMWLKWYTFFIKATTITFINDDSKIDIYLIIKEFNILYENSVKFNIIEANNICKDSSIKDRQVYNYNWVIQYILKPENDDIILIPDDDEFWWYNKSKYTTFQECAAAYKNNLYTNIILVANILMSANNEITERNEELNFNDVAKYRCNIPGCEHKPIYFYDGKKMKSYHYYASDFKTLGERNWPNDIGSQVLYNEDLRLYHYRFTTTNEFKIKNTIEVQRDAIVKDDKNNNVRWYFKGADDIKTCMKVLYSDYTDKERQYDILDLSVDTVLQTITNLDIYNKKFNTFINNINTINNFDKNNFLSFDTIISMPMNNIKYEK